MLGSVADAQDVVADAQDGVQDAWLRWHAVNRATVGDPRAYLALTVTRLCLDWLTSARTQRELYVGEWLPVPVLDEGTIGRAACRGRVCQYVLISVVAVSLNQKTYVI